MPTTGMTAARLAMLRAQVLILMPDTCLIQLPTNTNDGAGHVTQTWASQSWTNYVTNATSTSIPCRMDQLNSHQLINGRVELIKVLRLTIPYNAPISESTRIVYSGNNYAVVGYTADKSLQISNDVTVQLVV